MRGVGESCIILDGVLREDFAEGWYLSMNLNYVKERALQDMREGIPDRGERKHKVFGF